MTILFYEKDKPFYELTNFYEGEPILSALPVGITEKEIFAGSILNMKEWKTAEHLFQACKFINNSEITEAIRKCDTPRKAFDLAHKNQAKQLENWLDININVMKWILFRKFTQDDNLRNLLIKTSDEELIENSGKNDAFWGNGADGNGRNELGKALMELREKLK